MRNVELVTSRVGSTVAVIAPSSPEIYPPGQTVHGFTLLLGRH